MNLLIVAVLLAGFFGLEVILLLAMVFTSRAAAHKVMLKCEDLALNLIFSMFYAYRGFRIRVENLLESPLPSRFLVVSNHQSLLDIPILMRVLPKGVRARFVAKQELAWGIPLISLLLRKSGHCLVRRKGDALQAMRSITDMARRCAIEGTVPVIFPEGTRSRSGAVGVFHSAGYRKILEVDALPILVVAVEGGLKVAKLKNFFKDFGKTDYTVKFLTVLPPPDGKREALELLNRSREIITASVKG